MTEFLDYKSRKADNGGKREDRPYSRLPLASVAAEVKGILLSVSPENLPETPIFSKKSDSRGVFDRSLKRLKW
jgi:hypothetical protein